MVVYDHHFLVTDNITKQVEPLDVGSVECTNKERALAASQKIRE